MISETRFRRTGHGLRLLACVTLAVLVAACASPVTDREGAGLKGDDGLAAFNFVTGVKGNFQIKLSGPFGKLLKMSGVPVGESIYLYELPPGKYCIRAIFLVGSNTYLRSGNPPCFKVSSRKLTYAGTLTNSLHDTYIVDFSDFLSALRSDYPLVYARYVTSSGSVNQPAVQP